MTERSRRFSVFRRSFIDNGFKYSGNLHFIKEVKEDADTLLTLSTGLVRCVNKNLLDELVYNRRCQFSDIHILFCQSKESIQIVLQFHLLVNPFFCYFNLKLQTLLFFLVALRHLLIPLLTEISQNSVLINTCNQNIQVSKTLLCFGNFPLILQNAFLLICTTALQPFFLKTIYITANIIADSPDAFQNKITERFFPYIVCSTGATIALVAGANIVILLALKTLTGCEVQLVSTIRAEQQSRE